MNNTWIYTHNNNYPTKTGYYKVLLKNLIVEYCYFDGIRLWRESTDTTDGWYSLEDILAFTDLNDFIVDSVIKLHNDFVLKHGVVNEVDIFLAGKNEGLKEEIDLWKYPSKNEFPEFEKTVYIWDEGRLWRGHYHKHIKNGSEYKWWEVFGKDGLYSMQDTIDAWMPIDFIKPPKEL